jgi:outer membrane receptor protein involved in Fe transport
MPRFEAELNGFYYNARDKIKLVPGFGGAIYDNVQHTRTLGVEGEVKADVRKWLYLTANASFNDERLIEDYPLGNAKEGDRVPNQPWLKANAAAELTWFDMFAKGNKGSVFWEGGYTYEFYRSWKVSENPEDLIESAFAMNAGVQYGVKEWLTVSAEINDITDAGKYDEFRMPLPGRTFRANVHLYLERDPE